jgi:hypothetical protein
MEAALSKRVHELVEFGWEPTTTTETTASLVGRRPFAWWLFLIVIFLFPLFGGILYLIFWVVTSRATVFLHLEGGEVETAGDQWLIRLHEAQSAATIERQRQIKENGFLKVMWPQLLASLALIGFWIYLLRSISE